MARVVQVLTFYTDVDEGEIRRNISTFIAGTRRRGVAKNIRVSALFRVLGV